MWEVKTSDFVLVMDEQKEVATKLRAVTEYQGYAPHYQNYFACTTKFPRTHTTKISTMAIKIKK